MWLVSFWSTSCVLFGFYPFFITWFFTDQKKKSSCLRQKPNILVSSKQHCDTSLHVQAVARPVRRSHIDTFLRPSLPRHTSCLYADLFRPALGSSGERLQLPTSLCRVGQHPSSQSCPRPTTSSPNLTGSACINSEEASPRSTCTHLLERSHTIKLKPISMLDLQ